MKKYLLLLLVCCNVESFACDMCGCYMGIIPREKESSIGIYYRYRAYVNTIYSGNAWYPDGGNLRVEHGTHTGTGSEEWLSSYEVYRVAEVRGRYFLHPRLEVNAVLPYLMNTSAVGSTHTTVSGLGDVNLYAGWYAIDKVEDVTFRRRWVVGFGLKLPVGADDREKNGVRIDPLQQTGTGSTDQFLYTNFSGGLYRYGLNLSGTYKINGRNHYNERIGNSSTMNLALFRKYRKGVYTSIVPAIQVYYENCKGLYVNDVLTQGTAMNVWMGGAGVDIYYKQFSFSVALQVPIHEQLTAGEPQSTVKTLAGITWHFSQAKFLIREHSKS